MRLELTYAIWGGSTFVFHFKCIPNAARTRYSFWETFIKTLLLYRIYQTLRSVYQNIWTVGKVCVCVLSPRRVNKNGLRKSVLAVTQKYINDRTEKESHFLSCSVACEHSKAFNQLDLNWMPVMQVAQIYWCCSLQLKECSCKTGGACSKT